MRDLFADIAPAKALGIRVNRFENRRIELVAPFGSNRNDKGTAFAGSITSMLVLAGWGAITAVLNEADISADVMVVKSETDYLAPVRNTMFSQTRLPKIEQERIFQELQNGKRSDATLTIHLLSDGTECAAMTAHYAIRIR